MKYFKAIVLLFFLCFATSLKLYAQDTAVEKINWISFAQLNDSLKINPKKVFVNFHANWCKFCKEMNRTTFQNPKIIKQLNQNYYAVSMDVESKDVVQFGGQTYINKRMKKINPVHEIAILLASRKGKQFSLPAFILFYENFQPKARYFQYLDAQALTAVLQ